MKIKYGELIKGDVFTDIKGNRFEFLRLDDDDNMYYRPIDEKNRPYGDEMVIKDVDRDLTCDIEVTI